MFFKAFTVRASLYIMEAARVAAVVAGIDTAKIIDLNAEGVAASLRVNFETLLFRMIAPHMLADHLNRLVLVAGPRDLGRYRAAVRPIEPAVRAPAQTTCAGVRVFQAEALQMNHGIA